MAGPCVCLFFQHERKLGFFFRFPEDPNFRFHHLRFPTERRHSRTLRGRELTEVKAFRTSGRQVAGPEDVIGFKGQPKAPSRIYPGHTRRPKFRKLSSSQDSSGVKPSDPQSSRISAAALNFSFYLFFFFLRFGSSFFPPGGSRIQWAVFRKKGFKYCCGPNVLKKKHLRRAKTNARYWCCQTGKLR